MNDRQITSDRDLLELAAKAACLELAYMPFSHTRGDGVLTAAGNLWNPLTDDGDALRLAVKLRINLEFTNALGATWKDEFVQASPRGKGHLAQSGPLDTLDPFATTRRAIVIAAVDLAKEITDDQTDET